MTEAESKAKAAAPKRTRLPAIPETLLVRRKQTAEQKTKALKASVVARKARLVRKKEIFRRAEKYIREHRRKEHQLKRLTLEAKKNDDFYVPAEPRLAFVIRIVGVNGLHPKPRKILQLFRLRQINNGVFIRLNKATLNMLRIIEPYVAWGYPNMKSIHDLIYKRGFLKTGGQRIPITDNELIEKRLGKRNIICIEDLIHEIATVGSKFKQVNNALWPFKLNNPNGGWRKKTNHFVEGGDFGNREDQINALLRKMI